MAFKLHRTESLTAYASLQVRLLVREVVYLNRVLDGFRCMDEPWLFSLSAIIAHGYETR